MAAYLLILIIMGSAAGGHVAIMKFTQLEQCERMSDNFAHSMGKYLISRQCMRDPSPQQEAIR
jgi:hypothetical protein